MNITLRAVLVTVLVGGISACGGGGNSTTPTAQTAIPGNAQSSMAVVNISDAPSDRLVEFEITVDSIVLTKSDNSTVSLLAAPRKIEVTHLAGTNEALTLSAIPQGTYIGATISVRSPEVMFIGRADRPRRRPAPDLAAPGRARRTAGHLLRPVHRQRRHPATPRSEPADRELRPQCEELCHD